MIQSMSCTAQKMKKSLWKTSFFVHCCMHGLLDQDLLSNDSVYFRSVFRAPIISKMERFAKIVNG